MHAEESGRVVRAKAAYRAYEIKDRDLIESLIAADFSFHSPPDPLLDREGYFERCWPNARALESFEFVRVVESGEEVIVTYESTKADGKRFRNTEVMRFEGEMIAEVEVYFGWDLPD
jgi:ketosteroid isomerase-like protein